MKKKNCFAEKQKQCTLIQIYFVYFCCQTKESVAKLSEFAIRTRNKKKKTKQKKKKNSNPMCIRHTEKNRYGSVIRCHHQYTRQIIAFHGQVSVILSPRTRAIMYFIGLL